MGRLAINGGKPVRKKEWPKWPMHSERELELITEVTKSGNWSFDGPKELEFAKKFASYCGVKYGECIGNGTETLEIALKALDILPGDEVIVPALTWIATASAPLTIGAVPIFVDIDPNTYCIDPDKIKEAITERTKAIIPVHLYSCMADMDRIMEIAKKHNLVVIEDCAHTHGSIWRDKKAGSISDIGSFSFQQHKVMTSGEGGIVVTDNEELAERCFSYKNCGRIRKETSKYVLGWNYRITEFQASILLAQLERLDSQVDKKDENAQYLSVKLSKIEGIKPMKRDSRVKRQSYYMYVFRYDKKKFNDLSRKMFLEALIAEGIPIETISYNLVYKSSLWAVNEKEFPFTKGIDYSKVYCPVAEKASFEEGVVILHWNLLGTKEDMDDIIEAIIKVKENVKELIES